MANGSHVFEDDGRPGGAAFALAAAHDAERRMRQVKATVRLGAALRADSGLEAICAQVVEAVSGSTGFRVAALNLAQAGSDVLDVVATTGLSVENQRELRARPPRLTELEAGMQERFRRSRSYFIPHQDREVVEAAGGVVEPAREPATGAPDEWDPEDVLLTPLLSPRTGRLLGLLSLDQPEDRRIPTLETIEIIELFADQAALAIDTCRIFSEREQERRMLDEGLTLLRESLEQARNRDLSQSAAPLSAALAPLASSLDDVLLTLNEVLVELRAASEVVNQHASEARAGATYLATSAQDQAERILELSHVIEGMTDNVRQIAATAGDSSALAQVASEVSRDGSQAAELAAEGMLRVRELTLQTTRKVKRLGETVQDIGMIVRVVEDFASMTNVLALNASIEAARAGEHGRGFAVVAHEVRNLANSSADATRQIHARIEAVQSETGEVARQIESSAEQVVLQSDLVSRAGSALEAVDSYTQRVAAAIQQISDIAMEQAAVAEQVIEAIRELAAISTEASDGMEQARASMDYLVDLAWALQEQIAQFRLREDGAQVGAWGAPTTRRLPEVAPLMGLLRPGDPADPAGTVGTAGTVDAIADEVSDTAEQPTVIIAPSIHSAPLTSRPSEPSAPLVWREEPARAYDDAPAVTPMVDAPTPEPAMPEAAEPVSAEPVTAEPVTAELVTAAVELAAHEPAPLDVDAVETTLLPDMGADQPETTLLPPLAAKAQGLAARMDLPETTLLPPLPPGARQAAREAADLPETTLLPPLAAKARGLAADLDLAGTTQLPPIARPDARPDARSDARQDAPNGAGADVAGIADMDTTLLTPPADTAGVASPELDATMDAQRALLEQTAPALRAAPRPLSTGTGGDGAGNSSGE